VSARERWGRSGQERAREGGRRRETMCVWKYVSRVFVYPRSLHFRRLAYLSSRDFLSSAAILEKRWKETPTLRLYNMTPRTQKDLENPMIPFLRPIIMQAFSFCESYVPPPPPFILPLLSYTYNAFLHSHINGKSCKIVFLLLRFVCFCLMT
jgi:hypothetical protein